MGLVSKWHRITIVVDILQWSPAQNDAVEVVHGQLRRSYIGELDKAIREMFVFVFTLRHSYFNDVAKWFEHLLNVSLRAKHR